MRSVAAVVALVACLHACAWAMWQSQGAAPNIDGALASVSYTPFEGITHPDDLNNRPTAAQIRTDLKTIAPYTSTVRTYSSTGGLELVPQIAAEFGLKVTLGIWIDKANEERTEREIRTAIDLARKNSNVNALVVGNETILRGDKTVDELIAIIQRVKRQVQVPVTTGETWDVWLGVATKAETDPAGGQQSRIEKAYRLAAAVDFIGVHVLPYWDGVTYSQAVDHTISLYYKLRQAHPGKRIVIAEFGWPSGGYNRNASEPGRLEQATVIRDFVARANALGIDYNIIEAYDQPWKTFEGSVGAYWGLFDASRHAKFAWTGPISNAEHWKIAAIAIAVGFLVSLPILAIAGAGIGQAAVLALASNAVGAWAATLFEYWNGHYFVVGAAIALFVGVILLIPLVMIALKRIEEIAAILFGRAPCRLIDSALAAPDGYAPKVSIHIPAYREPPEMLKATLDSVARLNYANFECVVVINNTPDPALWLPVEEHCRSLGDRFKFVNVERLEGFKAGALKVALVHTAPDAEIIGVLDADYAVTPNWLSDLAPTFADPKVGLVQAPQDHRDGDRSVMHHAMNGEYAGFFDIGMVQRNEDNAIIVHGTMCLIRRTALTSADGWSHDTICEDTDLGLTIIERGWTTLYTNRRYGYGLLPDSYEAYKKQRNRWAYGGMQIVKKHWRRFMPAASLLTREQKREFALGWMTWLAAESVGVVVAILNLIWVPIVAFVGIAIPDKVLTLPILAAFAVSVLHFTALYRRRVAIGPVQAAAAMVAAMAMQWTVARAVGQGLVTDHLPFVRTAKGGAAKRRVLFPAFEEAVLGGLLVVGAIVVIMTNYERVREVNLFAIVLLVQSIPFLASVTIALLETSSLNDFALWRSVQRRMRIFEGRTIEALSQRPVLEQVALEPAPTALIVEDRIESVS